MAHYAYILNCSDNTLYTGYTKDLEKRVLHHNTTGKGAKYTRVRRPVKLMYSEEFETQKEAMAREVTLKRLSRKQKLEVIDTGLKSS